MKSLTASDRKSLIRLAASLPKGDKGRRAILAGLKKAATNYPYPDSPLWDEGTWKSEGKRAFDSISSLFNPSSLGQGPLFMVSPSYNQVYGSVEAEKELQPDSGKTAAFWTIGFNYQGVIAAVTVYRPKRGLKKETHQFESDNIEDGIEFVKTWVKAIPPEYGVLKGTSFNLQEKQGPDPVVSAVWRLVGSMRSPLKKEKLILYAQGDVRLENMRTGRPMWSNDPTKEDVKEAINDGILLTVDVHGGTENNAKRAMDITRAAVSKHKSKLGKLGIKVREMPPKYQRSNPDRLESLSWTLKR